MTASNAAAIGIPGCAGELELIVVGCDAAIDVVCASRPMRDTVPVFGTMKVTLHV